MAVTFSENDVTGRQTHAESARVGGGYESLDVNGTKKAYEELNGLLDKLASTIVQTLDEMVPYWAKMQSLLSQRGADRRKVLRKAGLPGWTPWAKAYAHRLDRSFRTIQERIKRFREPQASGTADPTGKTKSGSNAERVRLDSRQQGALVKAQLAANDLVAALENDGDWQTALATYRKVAVSPERLDSFVNALNPEPDWKGILAKLANTLEQCGDRLPIPAKNALRTVQKLLGGKPDQQQLPSGRAKAAATGRSRVQRHREDAGTCCPVPGEEVPSGDDGKPAVSVKTTACLPVRGPEEDCGHDTLDAAHVQGSAPVAKGGGSTPPEETAKYRLRKAKAQREYYRRKKQGQPAVRAAKPAAPQGAGPQGTADQDAPQPAATPSPEAKQGRSQEARGEHSETSPAPPSDGAGVPTTDAARRRKMAKYEYPLSDLEIIEKWSKTNWGTAKDIVAQCPDLADKRVKKVGEMCEQLVAEGRLKATDAPGLRYIGQAGAYFRELREKGVRRVLAGSGNSRQRVPI